MAGVHESIYPRFKSVFSERELMEIYTPSQEESDFAKRVTTKLQTRICFLITLSDHKRLESIILSLSDIILDYILRIELNVVHSHSIIRSIYRY